MVQLKWLKSCKAGGYGTLVLEPERFMIASFFLWEGTLTRDRLARATLAADASTNRTGSMVAVGLFKGCMRRVGASTLAAACRA
jgi:hypothetical protein